MKNNEHDDPKFNCLSNLLTFKLLNDSHHHENCPVPDQEIEGNNYEELIQLNNLICLKAKFEQVDQETKKLASKIKHGLEKFDLTFEQRKTLFHNLFIIYHRKNKQDAIDELLKDPKYKDLYNEKIIKVKQLLQDKKHQECLTLIGDSKDEILSIFKAQVLISDGKVTEAITSLIDSVDNSNPNGLLLSLLLKICVD